MLPSNREHRLRVALASKRSTPPRDRQWECDARPSRGAAANSRLFQPGCDANDPQGPAWQRGLKENGRGPRHRMPGGTRRGPLGRFPPDERASRQARVRLLAQGPSALSRLAGLLASLASWMQEMPAPYRIAPGRAFPVAVKDAGPARRDRRYRSRRDAAVICLAFGRHQDPQAIDSQSGADGHAQQIDAGKNNHQHPRPAVVLQ